MDREWTFLRYPQPNQQILGLIPSGEKGIHVSGVEMIFGSTRGGYGFTYVDHDVSIWRLESSPTTMDGSDLDSEDRRYRDTIGPACRLDYSGNPREIDIDYLKANAARFVSMMCSFMAEIHHAAELISYEDIQKIPSLVELKEKLEVRVRRLEIGRWLAKSLALDNAVFFFEEEKND